jgi:hypothetical protein
LIYLVFSIIYFYSGGEDAMGRDYIYNVLDWNKAVSAASVAVGVVVLAIFLHVIACLIQTFRYRIHKKYFQKFSITINDPQQVA